MITEGSIAQGRKYFRQDHKHPHTGMFGPLVPDLCNSRNKYYFI